MPQFNFWRHEVDANSTNFGLSGERHPWWRLERWWRHRDIPGLLGEEGERAEEEEHEEHAAVLEVDQAGGVDPAAASAAAREDAAAELQAHVEERAAGHHVELQEPGALGEGAPRADAERRRVGGEARHGGPHPPQAHRQEQRPRQHVATERPHSRERGKAGSRRAGSNRSISQRQCAAAPSASGARGLEKKRDLG
jgi:hypothetical protein